MKGFVKRFAKKIDVNLYPSSILASEHVFTSVNKFCGIGFLFGRFVNCSFLLHGFVNSAQKYLKLLLKNNH
jgi:hypothetical protein